MRLKKPPRDKDNKKTLRKADEIERQSFICDFEYKFVFALNYPVYSVDLNSSYF